MASIDEAKTKTQQALAATRELWKSTLEQAFRGGDGWENEIIDKIANLEYGFTDKAFPSGDFRYIRITDIGND